MTTTSVREMDEQLLMADAHLWRLLTLPKHGGAARLILIGEQAPRKRYVPFSGHFGISAECSPGLHWPTPHEEPEHLSELQQKIRPTTFFFLARHHDLSSTTTTQPAFARLTNPVGGQHLGKRKGPFPINLKCLFSFSLRRA